MLRLAVGLSAEETAPGHSVDAGRPSRHPAPRAWPAARLLLGESAARVLADPTTLTPRRATPPPTSWSTGTRATGPVGFTTATPISPPSRRSSVPIWAVTPAPRPDVGEYPAWRSRGRRTGTTGVARSDPRVDRRGALVVLVGLAGRAVAKLGRPWTLRRHVTAERGARPGTDPRQNLDDCVRYQLSSSRRVDGSRLAPPTAVSTERLPCSRRCSPLTLAGRWSGRARCHAMG